MEQTKQQQQEALNRALEAAKSGNPWKMMEEIHNSGLLVIQKRRICINNRSIDEDDVDDIIARSCDVIYNKIDKGENITAIAPFFVGVVKNKVKQFYQKKGLTVREGDQFVNAESDTDVLRETEEEDFLKKICSISKQLIQELKHENIKKVMLYIIEAIEKGHGNIPISEIAEALHLSSVTVRQSKSRGFRRLREKAVEKGFCSKDFDLGQFE